MRLWSECHIVNQLFKSFHTHFQTHTHTHTTLWRALHTLQCEDAQQAVRAVRSCCNRLCRNTPEKLNVSTSTLSLGHGTIMELVMSHLGSTSGPLVRQNERAKDRRKAKAGSDQTSKRLLASDNTICHLVRLLWKHFSTSTMSDWRWEVVGAAIITLLTFKFTL